ncbi:uncharacterized protein RJT20DRAFT_37369 [Scheffersomyces xylosifermentans]|uniref:uncharacterized protein n=1 Tax=Scheffersomyces xylosifermentans TaxID=1304137 RepID=UPI00315C4C77
MSSFSSLFGSSKDSGVDKAVENLFTSSTDGPVSRGQLVKTRTVVEVPEIQQNDEDEDMEESEDDSASDDEEEDEEEIPIKESKKDKKKKDLNEDLEAEYYSKLLKEDTKKSEEDEEARQSAEKSGSDSDSEEKEEKKEKARKATKIDLKETELEKAERTIFVGNVTAEVITSKPVSKKFKKFFSQYGAIDSVRFRSISFEGLPRKVAFARKNLHKSRDTLNAYVVYKAKEDSLKAVREANASVFEDFHLRVDHVAHPAPKDNRRTIFVGNLDFEEKEETLWKYFNGKLDNDVESVRVIRDSKTNVGKGFALVQFKDTLSVNKALLLNEKPLPVEKDSNKKGRKLRITRAKSHTKPSILSPNHIDNQKKTFAANKSKSLAQKLTDQQKTKLGRAKTILGKADRATVGKKVIVEGPRASKGQSVVGIKGLKGKNGKVKKPRIRDRSTKFKSERDSMQKELSKK